MNINKSSFNRSWFLNFEIGSIEITEHFKFDLLSSNFENVFLWIDQFNVEIFGKLPRLKIKTPLGEYNPDFCYCLKSQNGNKVFLIVEAKGYKTSSDIPVDQKAKIDFAKEYFKALQNYYKDQNIKIEFKERINNIQLSSLINNL